MWTLSDTRKVAHEVALEEVKRKLSIDDPNSEFRREIDTIVARGLIDSYLLSMARNNGKVFRQDLAIPETDLQRLQNLIIDSRTTLKDFSDALEVLLRSGASGRDEALERLIEALGLESAEKYRWIDKQPEKMAALLGLYKGDKLIEVSKNILVNDKSPNLLLIAAIKYSGSRDKNSSQSLERLVKNKDSEIANEAVFALAKVKPSSAVFKAILEKPKNTDNDADWVTAIRVAIELAKPIKFDNDDLHLEERQKITAEVLQNAINQGYVFRISTPFNERSGVSLYISSRKSPRIHPIPMDIILGNSSGAVRGLLRRSASHNETLLKTIRAFCLYDDFRCWGVVRAKFIGGGKVILQTGLEIDGTKVPAGFGFRPESEKPDSVIVVTWIDEGVLKRGILASISDASHVNFSVAANKFLTPDDEE